jgi:hypothetical protein
MIFSASSVGDVIRPTRHGQRLDDYARRRIPINQRGPGAAGERRDVIQKTLDVDL